MEIDDYRDYEKACGALREALKYLVKAETRSASEMAEHTQRRIDLIEKFLAAKDLATKNVEQMIEICESLLNERHLEDAIRTGDILAALIEVSHASRNLDAAYRYVQMMEERNIAVTPYVDADILNDIYRAAGVTPGDKKRRGSVEQKQEVNSDASDVDDEIDEVRGNIAI